MIKARCDLKCSKLFDSPSAKATSFIIKWEWQVGIRDVALFKSLDMIRLQRVNKGFKECVDIVQSTA